MRVFYRSGVKLGFACVEEMNFRLFGSFFCLTIENGEELCIRVF